MIILFRNYHHPLTTISIYIIQLCDTYPQCLFVPSSVSTIVLVGSASFRSKGRLPVLTYLHKNQVKKNIHKFIRTAHPFLKRTNVIAFFFFFIDLCISQAALCRCSQPLSGFSARCVEDEQLLNGIVQANPNAKFMYVVDTRPRVSIYDIVPQSLENSTIFF